MNLEATVFVYCIHSIGGRLLGMICLDKGILNELLQEIQISYIFCAFESF